MEHFRDLASKCYTRYKKYKNEKQSIRRSVGEKEKQNMSRQLIGIENDFAKAELEIFECIDQLNKFLDQKSQ